MAQHRFVANGESLKIFEINPRFSAACDGRELHAVVAAEDVIVLAPEP